MGSEIGMAPSWGLRWINGKSMIGQILNFHLWGLRLVVPERGSDIVRSLKTNRSPNMGSEIFSGPFFLGGLFLTYPNLTSLVSIMITLFHMILDPYLEYPGGSRIMV